MNVNNYTLTPATIQIIVIQLKAESLTSEQVLMVSEHGERERKTMHTNTGEGEERGEGGCHTTGQLMEKETQN